MTQQEFSRPVAAAAAVSAVSGQSLLTQPVLLTVHPGPPSENDRWCVLDCIRLLVRFSQNVTVVPSAPLRHDVVSLASELGVPAPALSIAREVPNVDHFAAVLTVGHEGPAGGTVINAHGWLARASSHGLLPPETSQPNPISALVAACLGASEVFKRLLQVDQARWPPFRHLKFNVLEYTTAERTAGPGLPPSLAADLLLVGAGAIGNGVALLLRQLRLGGLVTIVDPQVYGEENWGTSVMLGKHGFGAGKAELLHRALTTAGLKASFFREEAEAFRARLRDGGGYPELILTALDSIHSRHQVQDLWPDLLIDGATSDFIAQVSAHKWDANDACIRCLFRHPPARAAEVVASEVTGLPVERLNNLEEPLTDEDVSAAAPEKRPWLATQVGRQKCAIIPEALAAQLAAVPQPGFSPSVPFVSCLSAAMMMTELIRALAGWAPALEPRYQVDLLLGPEFGQHLPQSRRKDCVCVQRRKNIDAVRLARAAERGQP